MSWLENLSLLASILFGAGFCVWLDRRFLGAPRKEEVWRPFGTFVPGRRDRIRHHRDRLLRFLTGRI